jgi:hypothetical protein
VTNQHHDAVSAGDPFSGRPAHPVIRQAEISLFEARKTEAIGQVAAVTDAPMTRGEREHLLRVVRMRAKVAKEDVNVRQAQILADGEAVLSRQFRADDEAFAEIMVELRAHMKEMRARIQEKCDEIGVPATFRPDIGYRWFDRGENADPGRRAELRKLLATRAEAVARAAKVEVDRWSSDLQTQIIAGGLAGDARELLDRLPSAEALMPPLELPELGR